jgi:hypothetical protein
MAIATADSYTASSGAVVRGGRSAAIAGIPAAGASRLWVVAGDSITSQDLCWTPFYWMNGMLGAPLQMVGNCGFQGQSIGGLVVQLQGLYSNPNGSGFGGLPHCGFGFLRIGTNNVRGAKGSTGVPLDAGMINNYRLAIASMLAQCDYVVVFPLPPIGGVTLAINTAVAGHNAFLQAEVEADTSGRLFWIDDCEDLTDGSGAIISEYFDVNDELHPNGGGSYRMAMTGAPKLAALLANQSWPSQLISSPTDVYPTTPQWNPQALMVGTGGVFGSGWSGQCINTMRIENNGGAAVGTASIVSADIDDPDSTPWQRITPTTSNSTGNISISWDGAGRTLTTGDPSEFEQVMEVRFNNFTKYHIIRYWMGTPSGRLCKDAIFKWSPNEGANARVVFQQRELRQTPGATGAVKHYIYLSTPTSFTGAMGSFDFRRATIRG